MATVLRESGFDCRIYTDDHVPAHVHVVKAGAEVVIDLGDYNNPPSIRETKGMRRADVKRRSRWSGAIKCSCWGSGVRFMRRKMTGAEFDRQYKEAVVRGLESMAREPQAKSARYDRRSNRLVLELKNGVTFAIPCGLIQGLRGAAPQDIAEVELGPRGAALHWEKLDVDFGVGGLMAGIFGNRAWMSTLMAELGSKGGKARSAAKAASARANGAKGGRPRKAARTG